MRMLWWSHLAATLCPFHSKRLLILIQVQSIFIFIQFVFFCVISHGSVQYLLESKPKQQFLALIRLLLSAGPLCLSVATSTIMPHCVLQSSREQRNPDSWQYAQTLSPQGDPRVYSNFFFSLLPFFLSPHVFHILCSLIYYFYYCSSLDLIKVDFLQSIIYVVCEGIHHLLLLLIFWVRDFSKPLILTVKLWCIFFPYMFVLWIKYIV